MAELWLAGGEATMRVFALLVLVLTGAPPSLAVASEPPAATPLSNDQRRVRAQDPRIREALALGMERSASFRELVQRAESRDVIVYIELDSQLRGRLAGRMRWVVSTNAARYVRVSLNPELTGFHFVATLAHELQHVVEVGDAPSVVDEPTLTAFYRGVGSERRAHSGAWDTEAAKLAGELVRKELVNSDLSTGQALRLDSQVSRLASGHQ